MERWGCVDVPALPLQLLLREHPEWAGRPVVVVDEDRPQGVVLWVNERAHQGRVRPGLRYAQALSLAQGLCAGVVAEAEVRAAVARLARELRRFTPEVEPCAAEPGVYWLNASGFARLYPSLEGWAREIVKSLRALRFLATVVVGFDRFATYALARGRARRGGAEVLGSRAEEQRRSEGVPLDRLLLEPKVYFALERLGVRDVGAFRRLPAGGILERFGPEGHRLHRLARGELPAPLAPVAEVEAVREEFELDPECHSIDKTGLLFVIKQRLGRMRAVLARRGEAFAALELCLRFDGGGSRAERVRPAEPTLDEVQLVDLLRLRLESVALGGELTGFLLTAECAPASREQLSLFAEAPKRDAKAAGRALARLRAELGDDAVVCAVLRDGHLPEARFRWQPLDRVRPARVDAAGGAGVAGGAGDGAGGGPRLVRRLFARPVALAQQRPDPDGWLVGGFECGPLVDLIGPYRISGGWWGGEQDREYHFAETRRGDVFWVFYDRKRRRWFLHGTVE